MSLSAFTQLGRIIEDPEQIGFKLLVEDKNVMNNAPQDSQQTMGAAFANILGSSQGQDKGNWMDGEVLGCVEKQNVTMHAGDLAVVFHEGRVKALPNTEPVVWSLDTYPDSGPAGWEVAHQTALGKTVYWKASDSAIDTSTNQMTRIIIKYTASTPSSPKIVVSNENGRCLYFDREGNSRLDDNSYCQPISLQIVTSPDVWLDAGEKNECASTQVRKFVKKVEDEMKKNDVSTADLGGFLW